MLQDQVFDTLVDTKKMFVSKMKTKIVKRNYVNAEGESLLYLHVTKNYQRERIPLDIYVPADLWDPKTARLKSDSLKARDINLILDNVDSKITGIRTMFRLAEKQLTMEKFIQEFQNSIPRIDFLAFMEYQIKQEKQILAKGTVRRHKSIVTKLRNWRERIFFTEIDESLLLKMRSHFKSLGNEPTTIESNMAVVKKYINAAKKTGIRMPITSDDIKIGSTSGHRTDLRPEEIKKIHQLFFSPFMNERYRLTAGYFLFACFTGLRISDVQQLKRKQLEEDMFQFISVKSKKRQWISISKKLREILDHDDRLFVQVPTPEEINRVLKTVATLCGIQKNISFHVARHSFATNFLRMGGKVQDLQKILGHSKISETMIYVHIVESEACEKIKIMDNLW
ncbi:tyrosine-type recombinase/integrase [Salinimicrobium sp. WS361]|uniref:tyrosine-type recombinase/integrase n=1 Tax=Salinimicrobium sp. WS361 TaxID=3425123 RepID=UPI003D6EC91C